MEDIRDKREKKECQEMIGQLKEAAGSLEELHIIEIHEIELNLIDKITDKMIDILSAEVKNDLFKGAFKGDYKPGVEEMAKCISEYGYQPDMFDDKVTNMVEKLAQDPDLTFLLKHGVHKEAQFRHQIKLKTKKLDKEK
jgi:hypothetical protein